jgi:drug/metabolite transporter (DMT)-like permease
VDRSPALAPPPAILPGEGSRRWPSFGLLVVVFLIWSNSFIAARLLVGDDVPAAERLAPVGFVVARFAPVALWCIGWFALVPGARRAAAALLAEHPVLVPALGLLNVWGYNLAFGEGHHRVPAGTASLITALNPVLTFVLATLLRQERPTWTRAAGLAVAFGGIYLVVVHGAGREVGPAYVSDALILLAAPLSWALYTVLGKPLLVRHSPLHLTFLVLGLASLPTLPLAVAHPGFRAAVAAWSGVRFGAALFLSLGCTLLGFWLWYEAVKRLPATTAAAFVFLNPPLTLCFDWLWFGRAPALGLLGGGLVVLAGVYLCIRQPGAGWGLSRPGTRRHRAPG